MSFEKPRTEQNKAEDEKQFSAERLGEVRKFVEASYSVGLSPRDVIVEHIKEVGVSKTWQEMPKFQKTLMNFGALGFDARPFYSYNYVMGRALADSGCIEKGMTKDAAQAFLESQREPSNITDPEKYRAVFKETEERFLAENTESVNLQKLTEKLEQVRAVQEKETR